MSKTNITKQAVRKKNDELTRYMNMLPTAELKKYAASMFIFTIANWASDSMTESVGIVEDAKLELWTEYRRIIDEKKRSGEI